MNTIKRDIYVLKNTIKIPIEVTKGTDAVTLEFAVRDFTIPVSASAVAYAYRGGMKKPNSMLCDVADNVISFQPSANFFEVGMNELQIRVINEDKSLISFKEKVKCSDSIGFPDEEEEADKSLIEQIIAQSGKESGERKAADEKERSERKTADETEKSERIAADAKEKSERQKEIATERARIDQLTKMGEGSTTGDAELADIRVGNEGATYSNAGNAVRSQTKDVPAIMDNLQSPYVDISLLEQGSLNNTGTEIASSKVLRSVEFHWNKNGKITAPSGYKVAIANYAMQSDESGQMLQVYQSATDYGDSQTSSKADGDTEFRRLLIKKSDGADINAEDLRGKITTNVPGLRAMDVIENLEKKIKTDTTLEKEGVAADAAETGKRISQVEGGIGSLKETIVNLLDNDNLVPDVLYGNVLESWGESDAWYYNWTNQYTYNVAKSNNVKYKGYDTLRVSLNNANGKAIVINRTIDISSMIDKDLYLSVGLYVDGDNIPEMAQLAIGRTALNFENLQSGWNEVNGIITVPSDETAERIRLVVGGNCTVYFSPAIITFNDKIHKYTRFTIEETIQEVKGVIGDMINDYKPDFVFPTEVPCVSGRQLMLYYDNAILYSGIKNIKRIKADRNKSPYDNMVDKWFWNPSNGDSSFTNAFRMYVNNTTEQSVESRCWFQNVPSNAGSGKTKKCLFIGDSITQYAGYISELVNLFEDDVANIELLGTRESTYTDSNNTDRTVKHEGRGGWTSKDYCTVESKNGVTNPFLNNGFNFAHYMVNAGYSGVDYVFIMLGTNDLGNSISDTVNYFKSMYNSIKGYDSNVKVFISLCPALSSKVDTFNMKNKRLLLTKELIKEFGGKSESGIFLVPLYLVIDSEHDFPTDNSVYNSTRFAELPTYITDNTHMNKFGHYKMADLVYYTIKYAMQLFG